MAAGGARQGGGGARRRLVGAPPIPPGELMKDELHGREEGGGWDESEAADRCADGQVMTGWG